jgi:transaldolase
LLAARELGQEEIPVNLTLGFSARQNYFAACYANPAFLNVFLGRLNSFVSSNGLGSGDGVGERATLESQYVVNRLRLADRTDSLLIAASIRTGEQVVTLAGVDVMTIPIGAAEEYNGLTNVEPMHFGDRDLRVGLHDDASFVHQLWDISEPFMECVDALMEEEELDEFGAEDIAVYFSDNGIAGFLPHWDEEQIGLVQEHGKIPSLEAWSDSLISHGVGLDAVMTLSALYAFKKDQAELDERIKSLI